MFCLLRAEQPVMVVKKCTLPPGLISVRRLLDAVAWIGKLTLSPGG